MSTSGAVATFRVEGEPWIGRSVNADAYPDGLGISLFEAYHTAFNRDADAMIKKLILDPKADWSALAGTDMSLEPTWYEYRDTVEPYAPRNYYFRVGEGTTSRLKTGDDFGAYLYFIAQDGLTVYVKYADDSNVPAYTLIPWDTSIDEATKTLKELSDKINGR